MALVAVRWEAVSAAVAVFLHDTSTFVTVLSYRPILKHKPRNPVLSGRGWDDSVPNLT